MFIILWVVSNNKGLCVKQPEEIEEDTLEPVYVEEVQCNNNNICSIDFDKKEIEALQQLVSNYTYAFW